MRICVFGAGGVGGYFGGRLAKLAEDEPDLQVAFIARGDHLAALRDAGLQVDSLEGDFHVQPVQASADPAEIGKVDVVLVAVKAWQVPGAAQAMGPMVGPDTFVVPLQNGVDAPGELSRVLGEARVLGGLCHIVSYIQAPGQIRHAGIKPHIAFGELAGGVSRRAARLRELFERAGVWAETPEDIRAAMWEKFLFIAAFSGLGAVTRVPAGAMRSLEGTRALLARAMREIEAVARARGVDLAEEVVEKTMAFVDNLPEEATASMQRDIIAGVPSELETQNGAVARLGSAAGVPVPVNDFIYHCLLPQELAARRSA